ncbi:MAG: DUF2073 domain-containing protein [Candidatus Pacearchaeota archaeon]|nr:MAG: DUF2073 domain-containing protein [Candidatus Pacearchaeota archaeon]
MAKKKIKTRRSDKGITIQFIPYSEIAYLTSFRRVKKLVDLAVENKILLVQGKLAPEEEVDLIEETMKHIVKSKKSKFRGIELATFSPRSKELPFFTSMKEKLATSLFGDRDVITVIGPATIVREIKKDPTKIQLLLRK